MDPSAAVDHGHGDAAGAMGRPRERALDTAGRGHQSRQRPEHDKTRRLRPSFRLTGGVAGVRHQQVRAGRQTQPAAPLLRHTKRCLATPHKNADDLAFERLHGQAREHGSSARTRSLIIDAIHHPHSLPIVDAHVVQDARDE